MSKLGGVLFVMDGVKHDYPFTEAIKCLEEFCDVVCVVVVRTGDGTAQIVQKISGPSTLVREYEYSDWNVREQHGSVRLSYYTNKGIKVLEEQGCTHVFSLQADEILHESCYDLVKELVKSDSGKYVNYHCTRFNLWGSPHTYLSNPENGDPCSPIVCRLAKLPAVAYGDAESIGSGCGGETNTKAIEHIRIYHMGFVRDPMIHPAKIKHMQENVFGMDSDKKLEGMTKFNPWAWHSPKDTEFIHENLPLLIQKWAALRNY